MSLQNHAKKYKRFVILKKDLVWINLKKKDNLLLSDIKLY